VAVAEELWLTVRVTFQVLAFFLLLRALVIVRHGTGHNV
jgi:hypothetical protein